MNKCLHFSRPIRLTCGLPLMLALVAVPVGMTWQAGRQHRLDDALLNAAAHNDRPAVQRLLLAGSHSNYIVLPPPNSYDIGETSCLHCAAGNGYVGVMEELLNHGADVNMVIRPY